MIVKKVKYGYAVFSNGKQISKTYRKEVDAEALKIVLSWL